MSKSFLILLYAGTFLSPLFAMNHFDEQARILRLREERRARNFDKFNQRLPLVRNTEEQRQIEEEQRRKRQEDLEERLNNNPGLREVNFMQGQAEEEGDILDGFVLQ